MLRNLKLLVFAVFTLVALFAASGGLAQTSGIVDGVVKDPSGGVVPNATVEIS
jgi:hypothetical protein